jgi:hypothetical protein
VDRFRDWARSTGMLNIDHASPGGDTPPRTRTGPPAVVAQTPDEPTGLLGGLSNSLQRVVRAPGPRTNLSLDALLAAAGRAMPRKTPSGSLNHKMPPELWAQVADHMDPETRASFRQVSKTGGEIGALFVKGAVVDSASALKQAMRAYKPGGLDRVTLKQGRYDTAALESLPANLHELSLDHARINSMDLFPLLQHLGQLKRLHTQGGYGPNLALAIGASHSLEHVELDQCSIGDMGAAALARNPALSSASLFFNGIGAEGAAALAASPSLRHLSLNGNSIGNEGALALARGKFVSLNVRSCNLSDAGALALAANPNIKRLNLSNNHLSDACLATLESMRHRFDELILP